MSIPSAAQRPAPDTPTLHKTVRLKPAPIRLTEKGAPRVNAGPRRLLAFLDNTSGSFGAGSHVYRQAEGTPTAHLLDRLGSAVSIKPPAPDPLQIAAGCTPTAR